MDAAAPSQRFLEEATKLRNDVAAAELVSALDDADVPSILLKGPTIARWLYREGERRAYHDIDLLVSPRDFARAESALTSLGFRHLDIGSTRIGRDSHHEIWRRDVDGVFVELHRGILGIGVTDQALWDELSRHVEPMPLGVRGAVVNALTPPAGLLVVVLHAAAHGRTNVRTNADLERALERVPRDTWDEAVALARLLGAERSFALGLSFAPGGPELCARHGLEGTVSTELLLRTFAAPPTSMGWERLARTRGGTAKFKYLLAELAPTSDFMRAADPLATRGRAGLAAAYLRRPFTLARQAPRGFLAWRKARSQGG